MLTARRGVLLGWAAAVAFAASVAAQQVDTAAAMARLSPSPGDRIQVRIPTEPTLSGDVTVDENGGVTLPKLGPVHVAGLDMDSIRTSLIAEYGKYLRDPAVQLTLVRRFNVSGAVNRPGPYYVDATMGLADLIAQAGGASNDGRQDRVELWRSGQKVRTIELRSTEVRGSSLLSGDEIHVPLKSWVSRNPGIVAGTLTAVAGIVVTLLTR